MFEPRRKLAPKPASVQALTSVPRIDEQRKLVVQVVRGRNLPSRRPPEADGRGQTRRADPLLCFVEVRFQGGARQTSSQLGESPQWNECLTLPFVPPREQYTAATLNSIQDEVSVFVFDEAVTEHRGDSRDRFTTIVRRQRRFLGQLSIPFSTLYNTGAVSGEIKLQVPEALLGYSCAGGGDGHGGATSGNEVNARRGRLPDHGGSYLYLNVTFDPPLPPAEVGVDLGTLRVDRITRRRLELALAWSKRGTAKGRYTVPWVTGMNGVPVLPMQYLRPQAPPPELLPESGGRGDAEASVAYFVSLIPYLADWHVHRGKLGKSILHKVLVAGADTVCCCGRCLDHI